MMNKITIISGSPNKKSRVNGLVDYAAKLLIDHGYEVSIIQVATLPAEDVMYAHFGSKAILEANAQVAEATGIIIVSPVYKTTLTGLVKAYIDLLPQKGLEHKIVATYLVGATISNLLSIDYGVKPILASMGAHCFAKNVFAVDHQIERIEENEDQIHFVLSEEMKQRVEQSVNDMINYRMMTV